MPFLFKVYNEPEVQLVDILAPEYFEISNYTQGYTWRDDVLLVPNPLNVGVTILGTISAWKNTWGQPTNMYIDMEKTDLTDPDKLFNYIRVKVIDSAGEPLSYTAGQLTNITLTNTGLSLNIPLSYDLGGTPPYNYSYIQIVPAAGAAWDINITKLQLLAATVGTEDKDAAWDTTTYRGTSHWTGDANITWETYKGGDWYGDYGIGGVNTPTLTVNGAWAVGFRPSKIALGIQQTSATASQVSASIQDASNNVIGSYGPAVVATPAIFYRVIPLDFTGKGDIAKIVFSDIFGQSVDFRLRSISFQE